MTNTAIVPANENSIRTAGPSALAFVKPEAQELLQKMFADPQILAKQERAALVAQLRECVAQYPKVSELRVLYGMALCVNLDAHEAMEELAEAVALAPNSFIAHLKMGELWMRLRVCEKAKNHTHQAALLAENIAQSEMARRQATTIRTLMREGIERDGYRTPWLSFGRLRRLWTRNRSEALATVEAQ